MTRRASGDEGIALITAVLVMSVVVGLSLLIVGVAVASNRDSGRDRQRVTAIQVAEAQVDTTYASLQTSGSSLLPCSPTTSSVATRPDTINTVVSIKYVYQDQTVAPSCPAVSGQVVTGAIIDSVSTAVPLAGAPAPTKRHMQSYVKLTPNYANGLDKAIFAGGSFTSNNQTTLHGNGASNADVYSRNDFSCGNNQSYDGAVYSLGTITMTNTCSVNGDVWSVGDVTQSGNAAVGGKVWSSNGTVSLSSQTTVTSNLKAHGTVSWGGCSASKCFSNSLSSPVNDPPSEPFPVLNSTSTVIAFRNNGYSNYVEITDCVTGGGVGGWVQANGPTLPAATLIKTSCPVTFTSNVKLAANLAIFSTGGFSSSGINVDSTTAAVRDLLWIVPYDAVGSMPCTTPGISTAQQFELTSRVDMLLYSPCNITFSNQSPHIGQIYSGSNLSIQNQFDLQFKPVSVYGVANAGGDPVSGYNVDIVYKREVA